MGKISGGLWASSSLHRGHNLASWPSRTSARNPGSPGLLAGLNMALGFSPPSPYSCPVLHLECTLHPGALQSACQVSKDQRTHGPWETRSTLSNLLLPPPHHFLFLTPTVLPYTHTHTHARTHIHMHTQGMHTHLTPDF